MSTIPVPKFKVGDKVNAISFVDCFHKVIDAVPGLIVSRVIQMEGCPNPYYRVTANHPDECNRTMVEGAERFFEPAA
jgi:hypothetical protein